MVAARPLRVLFLAALFLLFIGPGTADAGDVTAEEFVDLVDRAAAADLGDLTDVTSVNSVPVDIDDLILSGSLDERETRLESLRLELSEFDTPDLDAADLRNEADRILSNPPYTAGTAGNNGIMVRVLEFLGRILGNDAAQGIAIVVVIIVGLLIAIPILDRIARRRQTNGEQAPEPIETINYESEAEAAASRGDHEAAVRLLFLDGADHLERNHVVANAATISTSTIRRLSDETGFLDRFDEIAYGGSDAASTDVSQARTAWQRLKNRTWRR